MASLASQRPELRVVADQVGAPTSPAVVAEGLARILAAPAGELSARFAAAHGVVHLTAAGATSWHGFATGIVQGLKARGVPVKAERVVPICTDEYSSKAIRPRNSRLDLRRLSQAFGITPPHWTAALEIELDRLVGTRPPDR
jgi:dTDP-4-dehydrorhamnose reductase